MGEANDPIDRATDPAEQELLAARLRDPSVYGAGAGAVQTLETHISHLFLVGPWVYKIKKAVDFGFLDFRSLRARHFYCLEELRLNRRLAPDLYRAVIPITGSARQPVLDGDGEPIEWAVKMRRFAQEDRLDHRLAAGRLSIAHIDELARAVADFHGRVAAATDTDAFGTAQAVRQPALDNFAQTTPLLDDAADRLALDALRTWTERSCEQLQRQFDARKRAGFVRECHGDLYLANIALVRGRVTLFDCLEFNAELRWIDVMNDVAFLVMDLQSRHRDDLAQRFLNAYLERTGDYAGLRVLDFYRIYRALVRAKIACMRARQERDANAPQPDTRQRRARAWQRAAPSPEQPQPPQAREPALDEYRMYAALARSFMQRPPPVLLITHGLSGSGKTVGSQSLLELIGALRIRSDVERKRLRGLAAVTRTRSELGQGLYAADATARTYARLLDLAQVTLAAGYSAIVDASFLQRGQRDAFRRLAADLAVPFWILDFVVDDTLARSRILRRQRAGRDASEADLGVYEHQLATREALSGDERALTYTCDSAALAGTRDPALFWAPLLQRLRDVRS